MPDGQSTVAQRTAPQVVPEVPTKSARFVWGDALSQMLQVVSVVIGVVISVLSFNSAREMEARARHTEAEAKKWELQKYENQRQDDRERQQAEAAKPFLELRQKLYLEAVQVAGVLANPSDHPESDVKQARTRFRQLYVSELSLVEGFGVEQGMMNLAQAVDPELSKFTKKQEAAYFLAHALRDSLVKSWKLTNELVDNPGQQN